MLRKKNNLKKTGRLNFFILSSAVILWQGVFFSSHVQASNKWHYDGGLNLIHQQTSDTKIDQNTSISADLVLLKPTQNGAWTIHLEGSNTPNPNGIANIIQNSNADSGSSLTNRDQGRFQLSELNYKHNFKPDLAMTFGLVDATTFLDSGEIMNDENKHFISASLVNNPIIDFPDYVIGGALEVGLNKSFSANVFISSTHGISDNNNRNYASLFEVNEDEKGLFSAIELEYSQNNTFVRSGYWLHNGKHEALDGSNRNDLSNYGGYFNAGYKNGPHQYESRFGVANEDVSSAKSFFALGYQYQIQQMYLGAGYSAMQFSSQLIERPKTTETLEAFLRIPLNKNWHITPSVQWFNHPIYESYEIETPTNVMTANLRINAHF